MGSQRAGHNWATEQNWTEPNWSGYRGLHFFFYKNIIYIVDVATCLAGTDGKRTEFHFSGKLLAKDTFKNCMPSAATWMDLEIVILIEVRQRKTNIFWYLYMWNLKKWYKWTYLQNRNRVTDVENKLMVTSSWVEMDKLGDWDWHIHTTIYKVDNS